MNSSLEVLTIDTITLLRDARASVRGICVEVFAALFAPAPSLGTEHEQRDLEQRLELLKKCISLEVLLGSMQGYQNRP